MESKAFDVFLLVCATNYVLVSCGFAGQSLATEPGLYLSSSTEIQGESPPCEVYSLAFSPDGKQLAVGSENRFVTLIHSSKSGSPTTLGTCNRGNISVAFSPNVRSLALACNEIQLWDLTAKVLNATFKGANSVAISPDGKTLAAGGDPVLVYDVTTGKVISKLGAWNGTDVMDTALYDPGGNTFSFSSDGTTLAVHTNFFDDELPLVNRMQLWHVETGRLKAFFPGGPGRFLPGDKLVAYVSDGLSRFRAGQIHLIDTMSYQRTEVLLTRSVRDFAVSPDGRCIVAAEGDKLSVWTVDRRRVWRRRNQVGNPSKISPQHMRAFTCVMFSPDGKQIATGGRDGWVRLWSIRR